MSFTGSASRCHPIAVVGVAVAVEAHCSATWAATSPIGVTDQLPDTSEVAESNEPVTFSTGNSWNGSLPQCVSS